MPNDQKRLRCLTCGHEEPWYPIPEPCRECGGTEWRDIVPRASMRCDFCGDSEIAYEYDAAGFTITDLVRTVPHLEGRKIPSGEIIGSATKSEQYTHDSIGAWAVCARCSDDIEKKKWARLARRAKVAMEREAGTEIGDFHYKDIVEQFSKSMTGKRRKVRKRMTMADELPPEMSNAMWSKALNAQSLIYEFWHSDWGNRVATSYTRSRMRVDRFPDWMRQSALDVETETMIRIGDITSRADTYYVAPDMVDLLEVAAPTMPDQKLYLSDLPGAFGFVYLDRSHSIKDVREKWLGFRAFAWALISRPDGKQAVAVIGYSDMTDTKANDTDLQDGTMFDPGQFKHGTHSQYLIGHYDEWNFGDGHMDVPFRQFMAAFWTLSQQPLAYRARHDADRATRRRFSRLAQEQNVKPVTVITLRRKKPVHLEGDDYDDGGFKIVDWSHRWIVRGHWANRHAREGLRLVWIAPYVKGPEDKPIIDKKKVYQWTR